MNRPSEEQDRDQSGNQDQNVSPEEEGQQQGADSDDTFNTDVSETDDEGTSVREAEVRSDDLSEVEPANGDKPS